jgi:acyl carrier protein
LSVEHRLTILFREFFDDPSLVLTTSMTAADVEDWDSLQHVTLMYAVEEEFGVELVGDEVAQLENFGALAELLKSKVGE